MSRRVLFLGFMLLIAFFALSRVNLDLCLSACLSKLNFFPGYSTNSTSFKRLEMTVNISSLVSLSIASLVLSNEISTFLK